MVEAKKHILTSKGMQALEDELQDLKVVKRKEIAQKIKEARLSTTEDGPSTRIE